MAVDLGFEGLRWLTANGTVVENETSWLHQLDPSQVLVAEALKFWDALRAVGTSAEVGMFAGPVADRPHVQNWSDAGIDMASRLADLLTRSGTMRWAGQQQRYRCDLGLRGELFPVGNASQVWNRQATVTVDMLTRARAASAAAAPGAQHFRNAVQPGAIHPPRRRAAPRRTLHAGDHSSGYHCQAAGIAAPIRVGGRELAELDGALITGLLISPSTPPLFR